MGILETTGIKTLIDIRLWRQSRFVPWASGTNLAMALGSQYQHMPELAPTKELLARYKDGFVDWPEYERIYSGLLAERQVEKLFRSDELDKMCFLCSEKTADKCHRRLVAEYLATHFPETDIVHL